MVIQYLLKRLANVLIRLCVCTGWSEPLLVAHTTMLEISCRDSVIILLLVHNKGSDQIVRENTKKIEKMVKY